VEFLVDIGLREGLPVDWRAVLISLQQVSKAIEEEKITPVRCLEMPLYQAAMSVPELRRGGQLVFLLQQLVRWIPADNNCEGEVKGNTDDLSSTWKQSLREVLSTAHDWRSPQILVTRDRCAYWPNAPLVDVSAPACGDLGAISPKAVPLVEITKYGRHPHARADRDPWDLRALNPPLTGGPQNPCLLPKPPVCEGKPADELKALLRNCCVRFSTSQWHYVPPEHWDPNSISVIKWRNGNAFPAGVRGNDHGYLDCDGRIWVWHTTERHWDVQLSDGDYQKVRETGILKD
jgi:hypothetical protein